MFNKFKLSYLKSKMSTDAAENQKEIFGDDPVTGIPIALRRKDDHIDPKEDNISIVTKEAEQRLEYQAKMHVALYKIICASFMIFWITLIFVIFGRFENLNYYILSIVALTAFIPVFLLGHAVKLISPQQEAKQSMHPLYDLIETLADKIIVLISKIKDLDKK